jgi:diguanylate cyclase (GGDEF)-like protein
MAMAGHKKVRLLGLATAGALATPLVAVIAVPRLRLESLLIATLPCLAIGCLLATYWLIRVRVAISAAVERLESASRGDLAAPIPPESTAVTPRLAYAIDTLLARLRDDLSQANDSAARDALTGLASRAHFLREAEETIARMPADGAAALFFVDLDRFKAINDTRGHACGDRLLAKVADRLRAITSTVCPDGSLIGRLAGDEFTLMCPTLDDDATIDTIGQAILTTLEAPFAIDGASIAVGASVGVACYPDHGVTLRDLMAAADAAMYHSKAGGRARVSRYDAKLASELDERNRLDRELRAAVRHEQFALAFQPQIALADGALLVSEALLRWRHPTQGLRPAAEFLSRAEITGQMGAISDWVAHHAAITAARWHREGRAGRLALNVGRQQVDDTTFLARLMEAFADARAPLERLEVELPESVAMSCSPAALAMLATLRRAGARITIDDFGIGESNVQRLRALPVDRIKLDRVLVRDVAVDHGARTILHALVGLVHGLGCDAVAEGVETDAQIDVLRVMGCDAVQGYAIARPMEDEALARWIGVNAARARA